MLEHYRDDEVCAERFIEDQLRWIDLLRQMLMPFDAIHDEQPPTVHMTRPIGFVAREKNAQTY